MARKNAAQAASDQIKDQVFSELQALIEESEKLLNDSAALVGEEAETLRAQVSLKLRQARQAASMCVTRPSRWWMPPRTTSAATPGRPLPCPQASAWWSACCWAAVTKQR
ncbi:hypothetical protein PisoF_00013 [Pseudomonas sp. IsoF]|nr:hypothetical protein PisoF_00013 [Pseudomonas sp. IsoF]